MKPVTTKYFHYHLTLSGRVVSIWYRKLNPFGIAMSDIAEKWLEEERSDFSDLSLVNYINAKMPDCAMTEQQFNELPKENKRHLN